MKRFSYVLILLAGATTLVWPGSVSAHGDRHVGDVTFTVGWADEPAFVGFKNGVQLFLAGPGEAPIEGAEKTLEVEVSLGDVTTERLALRTVFESPGEYQADLIPTAPGGYTFRFLGEVEGEPVDESFESPDDGFDEVKGTNDVAFPNEAPSGAELADRIEGVEATANQVKDDLMLPRILGVAGVVLGLVALVAALRPRRTVR
ncbi:MAG: hypothetical protein ACRDKJ_03590 [Actinomycetota bacterium]